MIKSLLKFKTNGMTLNLIFLKGDVPRDTFYVVYITHLIRFARASNQVSDLINRNKI